MHLRLAGAFASPQTHHSILTSIHLIDSSLQLYFDSTHAYLPLKRVSLLRIDSPVFCPTKGYRRDRPYADLDMSDAIRKPFHSRMFDKVTPSMIKSRKEVAKENATGKADDATR
jgi:hypothetical protein